MRRLLAFTSAAAFAAGCSLVGNFSTERCSNDGDCANKRLAGYVCRSGNCEPGGSPVNDAGDEGDGAKPSDCTTNDECSRRAADVPTACVQGACVTVEVPGACTLLAKDRFRQPNGILLGAFVEGNPSSAVGTINVDLALSEINNAGGVPTPEGPRYVSVVACTKEKPDLVKSAAAHLIDDLRVPAIFGQVESAELKELVPKARASNVLVVATLANDASLRTGVSDDGLLWYATDDIARLAASYGPLLARMETAIRASNGDKDVKIALLETDSFETKALASALLDSATIKVNGRTLRDNRDGAPKLLTHVTQIPSLYRSPSADYQSYAEEVTQAQPDIVIGANGDELVLKLLPAIEQAWGGGPRPRYVASPLSRYNLQLYKVIQNDLSPPPRVVVRFFGLDFSGDAEVYRDYDDRLASYLSTTPDRPREGFNLLYDTTYLVTYAARAALKEGGLDGRRMANGMKRLVQGDPGYVGTRTVAGRPAYTEIMSGLAQSATFTLRGTTGAFAIDPATRDRRQPNASVYCARTSVTGVTRFVFYSVAVENDQLVQAGPQPAVPCLP
jgi:ABC-type branched-subunit amino acid transport system substrate-binding protein